MRPALTRVLHLMAPGAALALLGLAGATAAPAAGVAGTAARPLAAPPVTVYVANQGSGTVTPIRVATNRPGRAINTHGASSITATPDGRTVYAGSVGPETVTPIRTATNKAGRAIKVGAGNLLVTPDGKTLYAVGDLGAMTPIRVATNTPGKTIMTGADPSGPQSVAITPNGRTLYRPQLPPPQGDPGPDRHQHGRHGDQGWEGSRCHRGHAQREDRLRRQLRLGHRNPDQHR